MGQAEPKAHVATGAKRSLHGLPWAAKVVILPVVILAIFVLMNAKEVSCHAFSQVRAVALHPMGSGRAREKEAAPV